MKDKDKITELFAALKLQTTTDYEIKVLEGCAQILIALIDLPDEEWRDVVGYEGLYKISNKGRIKSHYHDKEKILNPQGKDDYLKISLCKEGAIRIVDIHVLVAKAFIPNPENKPVVHHKDGDKHNNCVENLKWVTYSENNYYTYESGNKRKFLNDDEVRYIRKNYKPRDKKFGARALARKFNVDENIVQNVAKGRSYKNIK